jgi:triosephosphate isomerase
MLKSRDDESRCFPLPGRENPTSEDVGLQTMCDKCRPALQMIAVNHAERDEILAQPGQFTDAEMDLATERIMRKIAVWFSVDVLAGKREPQQVVVDYVEAIIAAYRKQHDVLLAVEAEIQIGVPRALMPHGPTRLH